MPAQEQGFMTMNTRRRVARSFLQLRKFTRLTYSKVAPPTEEEIELMIEKQVVFSSLHQSNREVTYFRALSEKITAFAHENIQDQFGSFR
jgi:NAD/NADP transhydrogenase alpha subunit